MKRGVALGSRMKDGRQIHMYMLRDLFVEVLYKEDKTYFAPEKVNVLNGLTEPSAISGNRIQVSFLTRPSNNKSGWLIFIYLSHQRRKSNSSLTRAYFPFLSNDCFTGYNIYLQNQCEQNRS